MDAIIIAAGKGSRLKDLTEDIPKCLLEIGGKTILQRQIDAYRENGISSLSIVKGYLAHKIEIPEVRYFLNDDYQNNNILNSLMYAEDAMKDAFIASYSDILFESSIVQRLQESNGDIVAVVDADWTAAYQGRTEHPLAEAENVVMNADGNVERIGKALTSTEDDVFLEFIGMFKCTRSGAQVFREYFHKAKKEFQGKPFVRAKSFQQAYITDFFQYLTDNGVPVQCLVIERGWQEVDVLQDVERAQKTFQREGAIG